jgi:hypothetical protein
MSDIPSWAVRRSKVMCVVDDWVLDHVTDPYGLMTYPTKGAIYTVREVRVRYVSEVNELTVGILLDEIENPIATGGSASGEEMGWDVRCFAPLVSRHVKMQEQVPEDA